MSPQNSDARVGEVIGVVPGGMPGDVDHPADRAADRHRVAVADGAVDAGDLRRLARRAGDERAGRGDDREVAADVVGVPVRVEDLRDRPPAFGRGGEHRLGERGVDHRRLVAVMDEVDIVVGKDRDLDDLHHQTPLFGIDAHGSAGAFACPAWSSSTEMPSGERTNAIRPSRGGRLIVTPPACSRAQLS